MPAPVLAERLAERGRVLEEDVDPDARVRARDAGHVAERASGGGERLVALDALGARVVQEQVRERVREVARQRDEPVVRCGIDRDGRRAEPGDEAVHVPVALRVGRGERGQEPGRALEEIGRARRRGPRDSEPQTGCPPTNRARRAGGGGDGALVEPTSVTVVASPVAASTAPTARRQLRDGRRDEGELGAVERLVERAGGSSTAPRSRATRERVRIGVPARRRQPTLRPLGGEPDGGADQPGADDGARPLGRHGSR